MDRKQIALFASIWAVVSAVYLATLSSTVGGGDSGELTVAAATGGVAHPPGFPLFTILGQLFSAVPIGTVAGRVAALSAIASGAAAACIGLAVYRCSRDLAAGVFAAAVLASSSLVWTYSTQAEVFALNNLFVAGLFLFSVGRIRPLAIAIWMGLALSNHQISLLIGFPAFLWITRKEKKHLLAAGLVLGLVPYLWLVWSAHHSAQLAATGELATFWGRTDQLEGLWTHVLRRDYGTFQLATEDTASGDFVHRLAFYGWELIEGVGWLGVAGVAAACILAATRAAPPDGHQPARIARTWLVALAGYLVVFSALSNIRLDVPLFLTIQERFVLQAIVVASGLAGLGWAELSRRWSTASRHKPRIALAAAVLVAAVGVSRSYSSQDRSDYAVVEDAGRSILTHLPPNAIVLYQGDQLHGTLRYLQLFTGLRPDVAVLNVNLMTYPWSPYWIQLQYPDLKLPGPGVYGAAGFGMGEFFAANVSRGPIFIVNGLPAWDQSMFEDWRLLPGGFARRVLGRDEAIDAAEWIGNNTAALHTFDSSKTLSFGEGSWERLIRDDYRRGLGTFISALLRYRDEPGFDSRLFTEAVVRLAALHDRDPEIVARTGYAELVAR